MNPVIGQKSLRPTKAMDLLPVIKKSLCPAGLVELFGQRRVFLTKERQTVGLRHWSLKEMLPA